VKDFLPHRHHSPSRNRSRSSSNNIPFNSHGLLCMLTICLLPYIAANMEKYL